MVKKYPKNSKKFVSLRLNNTSHKSLNKSIQKQNTSGKSYLIAKSLNQNFIFRYYVLYKLITIINLLPENVKINNKFVFRVIYLYDYFMKKTKKVWSRMQCLSILYHCMTIVNKYQKYQIFSSYFFGPIFDPNIEFEILETVDFEIDLENNIYDVFNKFCYNIEEKYKDDKKKLDYLKSIRGSYIFFAFFMMFHTKWVERDFMTSFISCLYLSYEKNQNINISDGLFLFDEIQLLISKYNYKIEDNAIAYNLISESKNIYKQLNVACYNYDKESNSIKSI